MKEITIYRLCVEDRIVVIASDGVWEVMENQEVGFRQLGDRQIDSICSPKQVGKGL